jgi:AcrR family transcriptional regulator
VAGKRRYGRSRRDLAEVAIRLFEDQGFTATTVEQIAEACDYSPRTFHRQFPTKEDAVFFDLPDILNPLEALVEEPAPSAWDAVCAIVIDNAAHWESAGADLAERRTRLFHEEPLLYRRFLEIASEWETVIARVFAAERGADPATDAYSEVLASSVVGACRAAFKLWLAAPEVTLAEHMAAGLELIRSGFGLSDAVSG